MLCLLVVSVKHQFVVGVLADTQEAEASVFPESQVFPYFPVWTSANPKCAVQNHESIHIASVGLQGTPEEVLVVLIIVVCRKVVVAIACILKPEDLQVFDTAWSYSFLVPVGSVAANHVACTFPIQPVVVEGKAVVAVLQYVFVRVSFAALNSFGVLFVIDSVGFAVAVVVAMLVYRVLISECVVMWAV